MEALRGGGTKVEDEDRGTGSTIMVRMSLLRTLTPSTTDSITAPDWTVTVPPLETAVVGLHLINL